MLSAYVQGDVTVITQILSQVAMIFDGNPFISAAKAMVMIGIVVGLFMGLAQGARLSIMTFVWPVIIIIFGLIPKVDLVFEDPKGGVAVVDDLPIIVAAPISFITRMGHGLTEMVGDTIAIEDLSMTISNGTIVSLRSPTVYKAILTDQKFIGTGAQLPNGLNSIKDPQNYVQECVAYAIKNGVRTRAAINAGAFDTNLRVPNFYFSVAGTNGINYGCQDYYDAISSGIESSAFEVRLRDAINSQFGRYKNDSTTGQQYQNALDRLVRDRTDFYKAAIWESALANAAASYDTAGGGGSSAVALADAINQKLENSRGLAAMTFEYMSNTIGFVEAWSLSIMPIMVLVMLLGPMGTRLGGKYLWLLVWIQLWYICILITLGYMDAQARNISYNATTSIANFTGFMQQILRLQDVGYQQLSSVSMLSMFLIFGASAVFGTALQRQMAGGDFYDEKKNQPDTLSRQAMTSYLPAFENSPSAGTIGTRSAEAFGNVTFGIDKTLAQTMTMGSMGSQSGSEQSGYQTQTGVSHERRFNSSTNSDISAAKANGRMIGSEVGLNMGNEVNTSNGVGGQVGHNETATTNTAISGGFAGGFNFASRKPTFDGIVPTGKGGGSKSFGTGDFPGQSTAQVGPSASIRGDRASAVIDATGSNTRIETSGNESTRLNFGNRFTETSSVDYGERRNEVNGAASSNGSSQSETSTDGGTNVRTQSDSLQRTGGISIQDRMTVTSVDGRAIANNIASTKDSFRDLSKAVAENGLSGDVGKWMDTNKDRLEATFGRNERAQFAFAALMTMQGVTGNAKVTGETGDYLNALSDDIMARVQYGFAPENMNTPDTQYLDSIDPSEAIASRRSEILGKQSINAKKVESYIADFNVKDSFTNEFDNLRERMGSAFNERNGEQVDRMFTSWRGRLDNISDFTKEDDTFMRRVMDEGWIGAVTGMFRSNEDREKTNLEVQYAQDAGIGTRFSASEPTNTVSDMLKNRLETFASTGMPGSDSEAAQYMALAQLYAGAKALEHEDTANEIYARMNALKEDDPILNDASGRIEQLAVSSATERGISSRLPMVQQEYAYSHTKATWETVTGRHINDEAYNSSWGTEPNAAAASAYGTVSGMLGLHEKANRDEIVNFLQSGGETLDPNDPWCAAFINSALQQQGVAGTGSNMARSFMNWGKEVTDGPQSGDVVVVTRGDPNSPFGHVGFFDGYNRDGSIRVLGGNTGDKVGVSSYQMDDVLGIRRAG